MKELDDKFVEFYRGFEFHGIELGPHTVAEAYVFAGRMRKFMPDCDHYLVGPFARMIIVRSHRGGMSLDDLERIMINKFGDRPDIFTD